MTRVEKRALLVLIAALALGAGVSAFRRYRLAAAGPVVMVNELDSIASDPGTAWALVDINAASSYELEALPGIGPVIASRIVAYRDRHGPFANAGQLQRVSGIGPKRYESIRDLVVAGPGDR
ncbi:MAG: helix-hairpin-helix domain-containing protein [bacterium]